MDIQVYILGFLYVSLWRPCALSTRTSYVNGMSAGEIWDKYDDALCMPRANKFLSTYVSPSALPAHGFYSNSKCTARLIPVMLELQGTWKQCHLKVLQTSRPWWHLYFWRFQTSDWLLDFQLWRGSIMSAYQQSSGSTLYTLRHGNIDLWTNRPKSIRTWRRYWHEEILFQTE